MSSITPPGAQAPPAGTIPNFDSPASLAKWNVVCVSVCLSITSILIILRTYVRIWVKREWMLEDYMCTSAWVFLAAFCSLNTVVMHKHGGVHIWDLTAPQVHQAAYWFNVASIIYAPAILSTKLAILLLYRRVFSPHRKGTFDISIRIFIVILLLFYFATTIVKIWECTPRERIWNKSVSGHCINIPGLLNASGIFNTLTDFTILFMPIHAVWNLKTTKKRKIGVVLVFTVGFIAPAFSTVGVVVRFKTSTSLDTTWNQPTILLWGAAEVSTGIICVCIPALAILAHRHVPHRPTHSILKGESGSRNYSSRKRGPVSTDEVNLFDRGDLELQSREVGAPTKVVTGIVGGVEGVDKEVGGWKVKEEGIGGGEGLEGRDVGGIVRTVRMEQTYL